MNSYWNLNCRAATAPFMTKLPLSLQGAIENELDSIGLKPLATAREELTNRYRLPFGQHYMTSDDHRLTYLATRMPATFAALNSAMQQLFPSEIKSLLDLGAGPGTAMWAACEHFPIERITLLEKDPFLSTIGKKLGAVSEHHPIQSATWIEADLEQIKTLPCHDLITLSYVIGELKAASILPLINLCWQSTAKLLLIIEPGTPQGFERIRTVRSHLINLGAHIAAPCPHLFPCPMTGTDWCHFAARVERTSLHRKIKGGTLPYEDEKFSYLAVSKCPLHLPSSRIICEPARHSGHLSLKLCTANGITTPTLSKKKGELYKQTRKAQWGDPLNF